MTDCYVINAQCEKKHSFYCVIYKTIYIDAGIRHSKMQKLPLNYVVTPDRRSFGYVVVEQCD